MSAMSKYVRERTAGAASPRPAFHFLILMPAAALNSFLFRSSRGHHLRARAPGAVPPVEVPGELQSDARLRPGVFLFQYVAAGMPPSCCGHRNKPVCLAASLAGGSALTPAPDAARIVSSLPSSCLGCSRLGM